MRLARTLSILAGLAGAAVAWTATASPSGYHVEYAFTGGPDGRFPHSALLSHGGKLYGTVPEAGVNSFGAIYAFDPARGAEATPYYFKGRSDGANPYSALIDVGGTLYGTTLAGGPGGVGTVYAFDPASGAETLVYAFKGGSDGAFPGSLVKVGGLLYGTTAEGGGHVSANCEGDTCGTIFSIDPTTGAEAVLHAFTGGVDGGNPGSPFVPLGGKLYATGEYGGHSVACFDRVSCGMVFSFDPATGAEAVVHAFSGGADGGGPDGLIKIAGHLWGTTQEGGVSCAENSYGCGMVFELDPASGVKTAIHYFPGGAGGWRPFGLTKVGDALYGITEYGGVERGGGLGSLGRGTVYSLDMLTGTTTVLHAFHGHADGRGPSVPLIEHDGRLWGATDEGGGTGAVCVKDGCGVVFSLRP